MTPWQDLASALYDELSALGRLSRTDRTLVEVVCAPGAELELAIREREDAMGALHASAQRRERALSALGYPGATLSDLLRLCPLKMRDELRTLRDLLRPAAYESARARVAAAAAIRAALEEGATRLRGLLADGELPGRPTLDAHV